jgi:hypothetical protein
MLHVFSTSRVKLVTRTNDVTYLETVGVCSIFFKFYDLLKNV